ncbi:DnaJ-like [Gracilariopsis chorda]|uniref:DnaJ homolog subfamily C member 2 n=1 Tax=Gracilariopsis chorda TaxID=448386 RepID=A0A2V3J3I6_9FLOR|nr:DnaJ-like [Gracilariopsis chorda]|eukprot:PXF48682.1 DnaJ-like [Gracilariopsis chorda]
MARILRRLQACPLCLPPSTGNLPEQGGIIVKSAATPLAKNIEHAGHCYQQKLIEKYSTSGPLAAGETGPHLSKSEGKQNEVPPPRRPDSSDPAKALASKMAIGSDDLYELLELGHKRWHATADEIKKSFRRISLIYHPDKISHRGEEARENSETHFKAVKKAYEILSDKKKRAAYDSIDDVDDSIPSEKDATSSPVRFYEKFGTCFAINARWSVSDRVPKLGDDNANIEAVHKFYDFWYSFKSWRDFSFDLEYDTDQAECREEKRWMERQNAKHIKSRKLEENARIRKLVDLAFKHDPRLKRVKDAQKAKKDAVKAERKKKAEEKARLAREKEENERREAENIAAEEKQKRQAEKKEREAARQKLRKARQRLRATSRDVGLSHSDRCLEAVEGMCSKGNVESIDAASQVINSIDGEGKDVEELALRVLRKALLVPHIPVTSSVLEDDHEPCSGGPDESSNPHTHSKHAPAKPEPHTASSGSTSKSTHPWTQEELSLLSKAVAKYPGGTVERWRRIADFVGTRSPDEVLHKVSESRPSRLRSTTAETSGKPVPRPNPFERFQEKKKGNPVVPQKKSTTAKIAQPPNKLQFTPKQQSAFETALKKHPATDGEARWKKVALAVGRPPEQCKERFQELITFYRSRKTSS